MIVAVVSMAVAAGAALLAWHLFREDEERSQARVASLAADIERDEHLEFRSERDVVGTAPGGAMFAPAASETPLRRLWPAILAAMVLVGGATAALALLGNGTGTSAAESTTSQQPLELLSLRHETTSTTVKVVGLVRNPTGNRGVERLTAVVFLFDRQGGFLGSGRAPLEFTTVGPGEESPFAVSIDAPAGVARFRVSFRKDEGAMVPHVDRREVTP